MTVVRCILSSHFVGQLIAGIKGKDLRDVKSDRCDDDIFVYLFLPTLSGLYLRVLIVFLTKSMASDWVLLDFQLPAIIRLLRAKE